MRRTVRAVAAALLVVAMPAWGADALPDGTAEQLLYSHGKQVSTAKVWMSHGRMRSETTVGGQTLTTLMDRGAKKMWVLMPAPIGCIEQPLTDASPNPFLAIAPADASEELVGSETIDGHPTKKYKVRVTVDGTTREHYQWRATDLRGFPIRTAAVDGSYEQRFTKVELKAPDAKLFEEPTGCRAMPMLGGPMPAGPAKAPPKSP